MEETTGFGEWLQVLNARCEKLSAGPRRTSDKDAKIVQQGRRLAQLLQELGPEDPVTDQLYSELLRWLEESVAAITRRRQIEREHKSLRRQISEEQLYPAWSMLMRGVREQAPPWGSRRTRRDGVAHRGALEPLDEPYQDP